MTHNQGKAFRIGTGNDEGGGGLLCADNSATNLCNQVLKPFWDISMLKRLFAKYCVYQPYVLKFSSSLMKK